jgi:LacI family transcriptional regulator
MEIASRPSGQTAVKLSRDSLFETLASLPKPMGLFAANDSYAVELIGVCHKIGLSVPSDASVVGVDNEEFLCENSTPSLTSIYPDFENEGYTAITMVANMLAGRTVPSKVSCGLKPSVIRKSAMGERYAESIVNRAMSLINAKATSGITVSDVCSSLRISRRLLDMRFKEVKKISPRDAIINNRLDTLRKLLKTSDDSIAAICRKCGFGSENHPKKLFRQRFGITMSDWRADKFRGNYK